MGGRLAQVRWVWVLHANRTPNPEPQAGDCRQWGQETTWSQEGLCPAYLGISGAQRQGRSVQIPPGGGQPVPLAARAGPPQAKKSISKVESGGCPSLCAPATPLPARLSHPADCQARAKVGAVTEPHWAPTQGGIGVFQVLLVNEAISVLIHQCEGLEQAAHVSRGTHSYRPWSKAHVGLLVACFRVPEAPPGQGLLGPGPVGQEQSLTSLNSWIWVCSKLEKTLEDALWARRAPPSFFLVFLLACGESAGAQGPPAQWF